jgi:hypothetical protein
MSLPNRSHSVTEMPATNGEQHHRRSGLMHSSSTTNNPLLYQRSLSYIKTINDNNFESTINNDENLFRTDKYNTVNNLSFIYLYSKLIFIFLRIEILQKILVHIIQQPMDIQFIVLIRYLRLNKMIFIVYNVYIFMMNKKSITIVLKKNIYLTQKALLSLFHHL